MDKAADFKKLNEYQCVICKNKHIRIFKSLAITLAYVVHIIMLISFIANATPFVPEINTALYYSKVPFLAKIPAIFPLHTETPESYLISGAVCLYAIPLIVAIITMIIGRFVPPTIQPLDENEDPITLANRLNESFGSGYYYYRVTWCVYSLIVIILFAAFSVHGMIKYDAFFERKEITEVGLKILYCALLFVLMGMMLSVTLIFTYILRLLLTPVYSDSLKYWKNYREEIRACAEFEKTLISNKQKADKKRAEAKKAEDERIERERRAKLAQEAEEQWKTIEDPEEDETLVKKLADEGSPSACAFIGKKMYADYTENSYTNSEKKWILKQIKEYLSVSALAGDVDSDFLILTITVQTISTDADNWRDLLGKARKIKKSGELSEEYNESCDALIESIIDCVNRAEELDNKAKEEAKRKPVLKNKYCRFCDHGVCRYFPNHYSVAKCEYVNDPGQCAIALTEKSIVYEFE